MFKHLLVPTDGSPLSDKAVERAVSFAKNGNAQITFFFAVPDENNPLYSSPIYSVPVLTTSADPEFAERINNERIHHVLDKAQAAAEAAGVPCQVVSAISNDPYEKIIEAAINGGCDLILMASHGYKGMKSLILGSQTQKVLVNSKVPVLVYR